MAGASFTDILQDRTHKYRRTLIAICFVLIALYAFPQLDFSQLQLFGIRPATGATNARKIILVILWLTWAYHVALFIYYAQRDWKDWWSEVRQENQERLIFDLGMFFWRPPSDRVTRRTIERFQPENLSWKYVEEEDSAIWSLYGKEYGQSGAKDYSIGSPH